MGGVRKIVQYPRCLMGIHQAPNQRHPNGPVVARCACCGKTCYFFGLSAYGLGGPPILAPMIIARPPSISK